VGGRRQGEGTYGKKRVNRKEEMPEQQRPGKRKKNRGHSYDFKKKGRLPHRYVRGKGRGNWVSGKQLFQAYREKKKKGPLTSLMGAAICRSYAEKSIWKKHSPQAQPWDENVIRN